MMTNSTCLSHSHIHFPLSCPSSSAHSQAVKFNRLGLLHGLEIYCRYIWESKADGAFAVSEDTENEPLERGTEIRLHLKEEAGEYLQEDKLKVC